LLLEAAEVASVEVVEVVELFIYQNIQLHPEDLLR
jgi:hypothetical protein